MDYSDTGVDHILDIHNYLMKKNDIDMTYNKMLWFVKQILISAMMFFDYNLTSVSSLKYISMNNQECKVRSQVVNVNRKEPVFLPFIIKTTKFSGSCNNINNPYAKLCVTDVIKNLNVRPFNLMSRANETRHIEWHETCN